MTLNLTSSPWPNHLHFHHFTHTISSKPQIFYTFRTPNPNYNNNIKASLSESYHEHAVANGDDNTGDNEMIISRVAAAKDANEALQVFGEMTKRSSGVVSVSDCCLIISAAIDRSNIDLALSVFTAMRSSFNTGIFELIYSFRNYKLDCLDFC